MEESEQLTSSLCVSCLEPEDYLQLPDIWISSGIDWSDVDTEKRFRRFLKRNVTEDGIGLSSVARCEDRVVGVLMCGEDGLFAYVYHVAVTSEYRRRGVGTMLVKRSMHLLRSCGIDECRLFVRYVNANGRYFWSSLGFKERETVYCMSNKLL